MKILNDPWHKDLAAYILALTAACAAIAAAGYFLSLE